MYLESINSPADISKAFHTEFKAEELHDAHGISVDKLTAEITNALK